LPVVLIEDDAAVYRAAIMKKTHAKSLPALGRIGLTVDLRERSRRVFDNKQAQVLE
jgi:hypothetical protein